MECVGFIKMFNNKFFVFNVKLKFVINVHLNNIKTIEVFKFNKQKKKLKIMKKN